MTGAAMLPIKTLLHPTDFSPDSMQAFEMACSLAGRYKAHIVMLHVILPSAAAFGEKLPDPSQPVEAQEHFRWRLQWPEPERGISVEHRVAEGDSAEEILRLADGLACDMIVMGTRGRSGLGRLLTGSVAEQVLRRAACPVLTVRADEASAAPVNLTPYSRPAQLIDVRPHGRAALLTLCRTNLVRTDVLRIDRWILPVGEKIELEADGETVIQCLEGSALVAGFGKKQPLAAGRLLYLPSGEPYKIEGIEDSSVLVTSFTALLPPAPAGVPPGAPSA